MQAYGTLTIVDLLDTATYIYYSANEDGSGASIAPDANTKYIGIYSGPALEDGQPSIPPKDTIWSKYVGEDGAPGSSITIENTQVKYIVTEEDEQPSTSANWGNSIPTTPQGSYLWIWTSVVYSDGSSTDTFSKSYLGKDANAYYIETNQEEVLIFKTSQGNQTSPAILKIKMYKLPLTSNSKPIDFSKNYRFGYIDGDGVFNDLITEKYTEYYTFGSHEDNEASTVFSYSIQDLINNHIDAIPTNTVLKFAYLENNEEIAIKIIPYQFGTSEDMAKFAVTAASINAAVGKSTLEFDADGLTIRNGGLRILGANDEDGNPAPLMKYDPASNALSIIGNGIFSGYIYAEGGEFTGKVTAKEGDIGGFIIDNDGLYSKSGAGTEGEYNTSNSNIKLLGEEGRIEAENIYLGIGAHINKYIQLGDARLWNPKDTEAKGKLLEAGAVSLTEEGTLQLGTTKPDGTSSIINLDGTTSTITGNNWSITPDLANFKNINVSGKISTVVFEQNHVQSVGGSMIFKPSYKVEGYEPGQNGKGDKLILDREFSGKIDEINEEGQVTNRNYVYLVKTDGSLIEQISITEKNDKDKTVILSSNLKLPSNNGSNPLVSLIDIGTEGSLVIGINSNDVGTGFLRPRGLTIAEYNVPSNTESNIEPNAESDTNSDADSNTSMFKNPKVFLGDLDYSNITFFEGIDNTISRGFGLYSENVYLTGSLTTQINNNSGLTYAGINTLNGASASKFNQDTSATADNSKIVFWAGAPSPSSIVDAPFQVTERGSLYAAQGLFEGAIISKSIIKGTDIYAARIHGEGKSPNGLSFYDTNNGIVFYNGDPYAHPYTKMDDFTEEKFYKNRTLYYIYDDKEKKYIQCTNTDVYNSEISYYIKTVEKEVFSIGNDGLKYNNKLEYIDDYFIRIEQDGYIKFIGDEIQTSGYLHNKTEPRSIFLQLKNNKILGSYIGENNLEEVKANISFNNQKLSFGLNSDQEDFIIAQSEIQLKKDTVKMNKTVLFGEQLKYEQTTNGYNLYVL